MHNGIMKAHHYRMIRTRSFDTWQQVTRAPVDIRGSTGCNFIYLTADRLTKPEKGITFAYFNLDFSPLFGFVESKALQSLINSR
ncbi:MAG: hypothetical protein KAI44_01485 [Methylococcales bacterium]|nr:hypothetical protein [Methylococcales bacterium]